MRMQEKSTTYCAKKVSNIVENELVIFKQISIHYVESINCKN